MDFMIDEVIWTMFPGLRLVVAVGNHLDNEERRPAIEEALQNTQRELKENWRYANPQVHPSIAAWREAFKVMGVSGKQFAAINPLVNFYNAMSLRYLVPAGGWDIDNISGSSLFLKLTRGGEPF